MTHENPNTISSSGLATKYPAILTALQLINSPNTEGVCEIIHLDVERVDANLLGSIAELCSGQGISVTSPQKPQLLGWKHEIIVAVDADHNILGHIGALLAKDELRDYTPVKELVEAHLDKLSYLLRVSVVGWCERLKEWSVSPLGQLNTREIRITVCRESRDGFAHIMSLIPTDSTVRLHFNNSYWIGRAPKDNPVSGRFLARINEQITQFEATTLFGGLWDKLAAACKARDSFSLQDMRKTSPREEEMIKGSFRLGDVTVDFNTWGGFSEITSRLCFHRGESHISVLFVRQIKPAMDAQSDSIDSPDSFFPTPHYPSLSSLDTTYREAVDMLTEVSRFFASGQNPVLMAK